MARQMQTESDKTGSGAVAGGREITMKGVEHMRTVTVYRVDYLKKTRVPIGAVRERRKEDRGDNLLGLLRIARNIYGTGPEDALHIAVDNREVRRAWMPPNAVLPNSGEDYSSAD